MASTAILTAVTASELQESIPGKFDLDIVDPTLFNLTGRVLTGLDA
jgi:hypothetical protein